MVTELSKLSGARRGRLGFGVLAFAVVTAVTYPIARYEMFTGFSDYDDEGYMLMFLKSFLDSGWHYDSLNGYGPFYYEFWGAVFSILGMPVNHNSGRAVVMVVRILTSLVLGLATWRMTRSIILGLATQLSVFAALFSLTPEPMHPGGIIVLLLAAIVAVSCLVRERTASLPMAPLGGTAMALILVKINVGIFALTAVALVCAISYPALAQRRGLRPVIEIGFVVLPLLLMRSRLDDAAARHYALHVCAAALAVVIALRVRTVGHRSPKELWWLGGGIFAVGAVVPLVVLAAGTGLSELIEGLITLPLSFGNGTLRIHNLPKASYILDLLPLAGVLGYWYLARNRKVHLNAAWIWLVSVLSIAVGLFMAYPMIWSIALSTEFTRYYLPLFIRWSLLSFVWVALIPPPGRPDRDTQFTRLLLPPLAVLQALHAFPVAGSQTWWSTFLLIPVGALCIANGVRWITFGLNSNSQAEPRAPLAIRAIAPAIVMAFLVGTVGIQLKQERNQAQADYEGKVSLELPGADKIYVVPQNAANFQAIVAAINENCNSFVMLPGLPSFYLWTLQDPPTGYPPVKVLQLVNAEHQQEMVEAIRSIDGLCLLTRPRAVQFWRNVPGAMDGPVFRYLQHGFVPIGKFGEYRLFKRARSTSRP